MRGFIATVATGLSQFQDDLGVGLHIRGFGINLYICDLDGRLHESKVLHAATETWHNQMNQNLKKERKKYAPMGPVWDTLEVDGANLGV